jgi:dynein heavy chain, axonemal
VLAVGCRCRQFPALINCTTIDWFSPWPEDALLSVAARFLEDVQLGGPEVSVNVARMCVQMHVSVEHAAQRYYQELRRRWAPPCCTAH